jgi:hypothetical protein
VEIERLKKEDISDEELKMIKTRAKANLIRSLGSNEGLAFALGLKTRRATTIGESCSAPSTASRKSPRRIFGASQVRRLNPDNRTVGIIEFAGGPPGMGAAPQGGGQ